MNKIKILFIFICLLLCPNVSMANDLIFPKTQTEIIKILSQHSVKSIKSPDGTKYLSEHGKVYKIIGGQRFRLRGMKVVQAIDILPKACALINFCFDSSRISQDSLPLLDEFGKALKDGLPNAMIMIIGHTDSTGPDDYNQKLSEKRAQSVAKYLMASHEINSDRLLVKGFGEKQPIAKNDTEKNRSINRRVEFIRIE